MTDSANKNEKLIVVPYRPRRKLWILALSLMGYLSVAAGAYFGGQYIAERYGASQEQYNHPLTQKSATFEQQIAELREQLEIQKNHVALEKQAVEFVRQDNKQLEKIIAQLKEQVTYYQRVVRPGNKDKGLIISDLELKGTVDRRRYRYAFSLVQISGAAHIRGFVKVDIVGEKLDKGVRQTAEYSLADLDPNVAASGMKVGFRNFQEISGEFVLPKLFIPKKVEIRAVIKEGKKVTLRRLYDWRVEAHSLSVDQTEKK